MRAHCRVPSCPAIVNGAANQHFDVLEFLVNNGANVNAQCHSGSSALLYAAKANNLNLAKV
jgi:ankyrin repeat protein